MRPHPSGERVRAAPAPSAAELSEALRFFKRIRFLSEDEYRDVLASETGWYADGPVARAFATSPVLLLEAWLTWRFSLSSGTSIDWLRRALNAQDFLDAFASELSEAGMLAASGEQAEPTDDLMRALAALSDRPLTSPDDFESVTSYARGSLRIA